MNNENQPPSLPAVPDTEEEERCPWGYCGAESYQTFNRCNICGCEWKSLEKKETGGREKALEERGAVEANTVQGQMARAAWIPTTERQPEVCKPVIGYADRWVDVEYNEMGMRECFRNDDYWQSAAWNNYQDCWDVAMGAPEYWMEYPSVPSLEPTLSKSEAGSEFSQIRFETGGRNALNLQMALDALEHCRHRPHEHNPSPEWIGPTRCEVIDRGIAAIKHALQSAQAASDGKEQGPGQPTKDLSGASNGLLSSVTETSANRNEPPSPAQSSSSSATVRGPMELEAFIAAAKRFVDEVKYISWESGGGPNECRHGYAAGIPCRECDIATIKNFAPSGIEGQPAQSSFGKAILQSALNALEHCRQRPHEHNPLPDWQGPTHCEVIDRAITDIQRVLSKDDGQPESVDGASSESPDGVNDSRWIDPTDEIPPPTQKPLSVILDEIEGRANLAAKVFYAGNVTNTKSAMDVPALVKALRRAMGTLQDATECNPLCGQIAVNDITAILNQGRSVGDNKGSDQL